jgi:hypothetical protein
VGKENLKYLRVGSIRKNNMKMDLKDKELSLDSFGPRYGPVMVSC